MAISGISSYNSYNRITGLATGLDTDGIIKNLMRIERVPLDKILQKKQIAEWKTDSYREVTNLLMGIKNQYMDILKPDSNMLGKTFYKKMTGVSTDNTVVTVSGNSDSTAGSHTITVNELASASALQGRQGVSKDIIGAAVSSVSLAKGQSFFMNVDGIKRAVVLDRDVNSVSDLQSALQSAVNTSYGSGKVEVKVDVDGRVSFYGGNGVNKLTIIEGPDNVLAKLGFGVVGFVSNRLDTTETLEQISSKLDIPLSFDSDGKISFTINGETFTFDKSTKLNSLMNQVSSNENAKVSLQYDEVTDSFKMTAKQLGAGSTLQMGESGGNFLSALGFKGIEGSAAASSALKDYSSPENQKKFFVVIDGIEKEITLKGNYSVDPAYIGSAPPYTDTNSAYDALAGDIKASIEGAFGGVTVSVGHDNGKLSISLVSGGSSLGIGEPSTDSALADLGLKANYNFGKDANVTIDNQTLIRSSNTFIVNGVTYNLLKKSDKEQTVTLTLDVDGIYNNIKGFVDKYNEMIEKINGKLSEEYDRDYQPLTDDQKKAMSDDEIKKWEEKAKTGLLRNDTLLQNIVYSMRKAMSDKVSGSEYTTLSSIGITTGAYTEKGKLVINETALKDAIKNDPDGIVELFTKQSDIDTNIDLSSEQKTQRYENEGLAYRLMDILDANVRTKRDKDGNKGLLLEKAGIEGDTTEFKSLLYNEINDYNDKIYDLTKKLADKEEKYYQKYAQLEKAISQMSAQSSWLSAQFGQSN